MAFKKCVHCGADKHDRSVLDRSVCASVRQLYAKMHQYFVDQIGKAEGEGEARILAAAFLRFEQECFASISAHSRRRFRTIHAQSRRFSGQDLSHEAYGRDVSLFDPVTVRESGVDDVFELFEWLLESHIDDVSLFMTSIDVPWLSRVRKNGSGVTLLHLACELGKVEVAIALVEAGFPSGVTAKNGKLPLHFFLEKGLPLRLQERPDEDDVSFRTLFCTLLKGVDVNYPLPGDASGESPSPLLEMERGKLAGTMHMRDVSFDDGDSLLHCAVKAEVVTLVTLLTSLGADVKATNARRESVFAAAVACSNEKTSVDILKCLFPYLSKEDIPLICPALLRAGMAHSHTHSRTYAHKTSVLSLYLLLSLLAFVAFTSAPSDVSNVTSVTTSAFTAQ